MRRLPIVPEKSASVAALVVASLGIASACNHGDGFFRQGSSGGGPPAGSVPLDVDFFLRQDIALGAGFVSDFALADLNGDGVTDLVQLDADAAAIHVARGLAAGGFAPPLSLDALSEPVAVSVHDFDGDGLRDIAIVCGLVGSIDLSAPEVAATFDPGTAELLAGILEDGGPHSFCLALYRQDALGSFAPEPTELTSLVGPASDVAALPRAGGGADVVVVLPLNRVVERFALVPGADPPLLRVELIDAAPLAIGFPFTAAAIDIGADGSSDLAVGELGRVVVYRDDASGGLGQGSIAAAGVACAFISGVRDIDQDGFEDLLVAEVAGERGLVLRGGPTGLAVPDEIALGGNPSSIALVDLSGDGLADVAAALFREAAIVVRHASAPLEFGARELFNVGSVPRGLTSVLLPGDARADLACANRDDVSFLRNEAGTLRSARGYALGALPAFVEAADLDQDGVVDAVSVDISARAVVFLRGAADGGFAAVGSLQLSAAAELPSGLALADLDGDGRRDVLASAFEGSAVQLLRNPGSLPFGPPSAADRTAVGAQPRGLDAARFDDDGLLDVAVASEGERSVQLLRGTGAGALALAGSAETLFRPLAVLARDLDGDGRSEAIVSTGESDGTGTAVRVFTSDGALGLVLASLAPLPATALNLAAGDFDADGQLDLVAGQIGAGVSALALLRNTGDLELVVDLLEVGARPETVEVLDVDQDGRVDLLASLASGDLIVALGDGKGGFVLLAGPSQRFPVPDGTNASALVDVDRNGLPDLLLVSPAAPHLWVAENASGAAQ